MTSASMSWAPGPDPHIPLSGLVAAQRAIEAAGGLEAVEEANAICRTMVWAVDSCTVSRHQVHTPSRLLG